MKATLEDQDYQRLLSQVTDANKAISLNYPGDSEKRQPVHTVYGGAHLYKKDMAKKMRDLSQGLQEKYK